jgi:hypothetical protein
MEKYIMKTGVFMSGLPEIRKLPSREVMRVIAVDLAYNDTIDNI